MCISLYVYVCGAQKSAAYILLGCPLSFEIGSLVENEACCFGKAGWPVSPRARVISTVLSWLFMWILGIQTPVLKIVQLMLYGLTEPSLHVSTSGMAGVSPRRA